MKKLTALLLTMSMVVSLTACSTGGTSGTTAASPAGDTQATEAAAQATEAAKEASGKDEGFTIGIAFANENGARWHYDEKFMVETIEAAGGKALSLIHISEPTRPY